MRRSSLIFVLLFLAFWTAGTCVMDGAVCYKICCALIARTYPTVGGTVVSSQIKEESGEDGPTYAAQVRYTYTLQGREYEGTRVRFEVMRGGRERAARRMRAYPAGTMVVVHANPRSPGDSVLETDIDGMNVFSLVFSAPFNALMLVMWGAVGTLFRQRWKRLPLGGLKVDEESRVTRLRVGWAHPLLWGIAATGGAGFVAVFAVGLCTGIDPSPAVASVTLAATFGAGLATGLLVHIRREKYDRFITIDGDEGVLTLPATRRPERCPERRIPVVSIVDVRVESVRLQESDRRALAFHVRREEGVEEVVHFYFWFIANEADEVAAFLRDRIARAKRLRREMEGGRISAIE